MFYWSKKIGDGFIGFSGIFNAGKDRFRSKIKFFGDRASLNLKFWKKNRIFSTKMASNYFPLLQTKTGMVFSVSTTQKTPEKVSLGTKNNSWRRVSANKCLAYYWPIFLPLQTRWATFKRWEKKSEKIF